jgi:hypothetical protein
LDLARPFTGRLTSREMPSGESEQNSCNEQAPKDLFVVSRDPHGQIDIEIGTPVAGVTGGHSRQGTAKTVGKEDQHFEQDDSDEEDCKLEVLKVSHDWQRNDA